MNRTIIALLSLTLLIAGCATAVPKDDAKAATQPPSDTPSPAANATFVIHMWSWKASAEEGRHLLRNLSSGKAGAQSRDLGDAILTSACDGKVKPAAGCHAFEFEFHDISPSARRAAIAWTSAADAKMKPVLIGQDNGISVCSGQGRLVVEVNPTWATRRMAMTIRSPFQPPAIRYPLSGSLKTCGPATAGTCGGTVSSPTALYNIVNRRGVSHFHFVVE